MPEYRFNPPPGWPPPPPGWIPPKGWVPDPDFPPPPEGWNFWAEVIDPYQPPEDAVGIYRPQSPTPFSNPLALNPHVPISPRSEFNGIPVIYNRQQMGHSILLHCFLPFLTFGFSFIWTIYYVVSPNHYWHL